MLPKTWRLLGLILLLTGMITAAGLTGSRLLAAQSPDGQGAEQRQAANGQGHVTPKTGESSPELSFWQRANSFITGSTGSVQTTLDHKIWSFDGNNVTLRKLIVAALLLIIGLLVVRFILQYLFRRMIQQTSLKPATAQTIVKLLTYFAYLSVLLFALRIVNIPLAAFAFLGGAIAIGVGFGAQNLINNFISGFIIMGERPIQLGDLIELEGILGKVEDIGARCTRVRTGENIRILVPNSSFLEKNITNWTISDKRIRTFVRVGVVYGSPVKTVRELLLEAVRKDPRIQSSPAPFVLFTDFGDNALIFDVYFWIVIESVIERKTIESEVRFRIEEVFGRAGIVIAFPQRDVHLDASRPLPVEFVRRQSKDSATPTKE
ncbi:MAG: mechanosensitive ion channel family protein [Desulfosudaceae bacterium]